MQIGRMILDYCLNAVWLVPVVAGAAWLLVKLSRLNSAGEHRIWLGALAVCLTLPAVGIELHVESRAGTRAWRADVVPERTAEASVALEAAELEVAEAETPVRAAIAEPSRRNAILRLRHLAVAGRVAKWFAWLYVAVAAIAAWRMARAWSSALRLVRQASPSACDAAQSALLRELAAHFEVQVPRVAHSGRSCSPLLVGIWRPVLLLPEGFEGFPEAERRAALLHELAHLRRRDCVVHAAVQLLLLPMVWHPAIHLVARRIARTREMACDEMAAEAIGHHAGEDAGELAYARCLLNLARSMVRDRGETLAEVGLGLFRTNKLEERVMRLTEVKRVFTMRELFVRRMGGVAVAGTVLITCAMVHVSPVVAQESAAAAPSVSAPQVIPSAPAAPDLPPVPPSPRPLQVVTHHPSAAASRSGGGGAGSSVGSSAAESSSGTATDVDVFVDDHFAVARGRNAHVQASGRQHLHHWLGADGEPYESADDNPQDLTTEQKRALEAEFARRMAQLDGQVTYWKSPAWTQQLRDQASLAATSADLAAASADFNSPAWKAQMARLNSPEFKAQLHTQMKTLKRQMARLDSKEFRDQRNSITSAKVEAQLAAAERQAAVLESPEMQWKLDAATKRLNEASARLDAAAKALAEAQKHLQEKPVQ